MLIGQRLTVGSERRWATWASVKIATRATAIATIATAAGTTAAGTTATGTTTGTTTAGTTRSATIATRATAIATIATRSAATLALAAAEVARRRRQLPADSGARHLTATRTIVFLLLFLLRTDLQRAEATRLVAIAATSAASTAAATAIAIAATATIITLATTSACRRGDAIDDVVELAARDRAVRSLLALKHAHEANLVDAVTDDVECLEQARRAIRLNVQLRRERLHDRIALGRCRCGLRNVGRRSFRCFTAAFAAFAAFARRRVTFRGFGRRGFGRLFGWRRRLRRWRCAMADCRARLRGFPQGQRRELRERLHAG